MSPIDRGHIAEASPTVTIIKKGLRTATSPSPSPTAFDSYSVGSKSKTRMNFRSHTKRFPSLESPDNREMDKHFPSYKATMSVFLTTIDRVFEYLDEVYFLLN